MEIPSQKDFHNLNLKQPEAKKNFINNLIIKINEVLIKNSKNNISNRIINYKITILLIQILLTDKITLITSYQ